MRQSLASRIAKRVLLDYIDSGRLAPGQLLPSLRALESEYGASVGTVTHALGQLEALGAVRKTSDGKMSVAEYKADRRWGQNNGAIGFAFPVSAKAEFQVRLYERVERACRRHGYHVIVATGESSPVDWASERDTVGRLIDAGCSAIVINPGVRTEATLATDYLNSEFLDVPIVLIDMAWPEQKRSQVILDNYGAGFDMTRALLECGHVHIAFMTQFGSTERLAWRSTKDRYRGYLTALREAGLSPRSEDRWDIDLGSVWHEQVAALVKRWTGMSEPPTAIMALEDIWAAELVAEFREAGVAVPGNVTVTGFDNIAPSCISRPSFLTTNPDLAMAGDKAVELALQELRGEIHEPLTYVLHVPVVERTVAGVTVISD
jgi:DNA-binding LacI/PurR family transcriptional regulator